MSDNVLLRRQEPRATNGVACRPGLLPAQEHRLFAASATRLAGIATLLFHWRPGDFWEATPAELGAVLDALAGHAVADAPASSADLGRLMEQFPDG